MHIPKVKDLMIRETFIAFPSTSVLHIAATLLKESISCLPVVQKEMGAFLGLISEKEVMEEIVDESLFDFFNEASVEDLMEKEAHSLNPEWDLFAAEEIFRLHHLRHAPVLDGGKLVGMISRKDLLEGALNCLKDKKIIMDDLRKLENYEIVSLSSFYE